MGSGSGGGCGGFGFEDVTDGEGFVAESGELVAGVGSEDHAHAAVAVGKASILSAVDPDGVRL